VKRVIKEILEIVKAAPNTASAVRSINNYKRKSLFLYEDDSPEHGPFVWYPTSDFTYHVLSPAGEGDEVITEFIASVRRPDKDGLFGEHTVKFDFGRQLLEDAEAVCQVPVIDDEVRAFHRAATALAAVAAEAAAIAARRIEEVEP
jgi:hypothetical protein